MVGAGGQGLKDLEQGCTLWNGQRSLMKDFMGRAWVGLKRLFVPQKGYLGLERALKDEPGRFGKATGREQSCSLVGRRGARAGPARGG